MKCKVGRRSFLKGSALSIAALGMPAIIPATAFGANDRIAIGCIGTGSMGTSNMLKFLEVDNCRVVAVCDVYTLRRENAAKLVNEKYGDTGCALYNDYQELLARKDIDGVMIAVQDHWHSLIATAAANAGKDMYCEKPTGVCINDGKVMKAAVEKNKRVFQSGTWRRSLGNFRQTAELALNGYIGKLQEIEVSSASSEFEHRYKGSFDPMPIPKGLDWHRWLGPAPISPFNHGRFRYPDWYLLNDYCEGWTTNYGVHNLDVAFWGCPAIGTESFEIEADGTYYMNMGLANNIYTWKATLTFASGLRVIYADSTQQKHSGTTFIGEKGWVRASSGDRISSSVANLSTIRPKEGDKRLLPDGLDFDDISVVKAKAGDRIAYRNINHAEGLLHSMRTRKQPVSDARATHVASTLGMITGIAVRLQEKLKWDWKTEQFIDNDLANAMQVRPMHNGYKL